MQATIAVIAVLFLWYVIREQAREDKRYKPFTYRGSKFWVADGVSAEELPALKLWAFILLAMVVYLIYHYHRWSPDAVVISLFLGSALSLLFHMGKSQLIEIPSALYDPGRSIVMYPFGENTLLETTPAKKGLRPAGSTLLIFHGFLVSALILLYGWTAKQVTYLEDGHIGLRGAHHWQLIAITVLLSMYIQVCIIRPDRRHYIYDKSKIDIWFVWLLIPYLWFLCWYMW